MTVSKDGRLLTAHDRTVGWTSEVGLLVAGHGFVDAVSRSWGDGVTEYEFKRRLAAGRGVSELRLTAGLGDGRLLLRAATGSRPPSSWSRSWRRTTSNRGRFIQRCVDAGLDVTGTVSSVTNLLVCDDRTTGAGRLKGARKHGTAVIDEPTMIRLLADVYPGVRKDAPVPKVARTPAAPTRPSGPLAGRRVLTLGGSHELAGQVRARVAELGGVASVNLTASVTDVVLLDGSAGDARHEKARARRLTVLSWPDLVPAGWSDEAQRDGVQVEEAQPVAPSDGPPSRTPASAAPAGPTVLIRGQAMDLPGDPVWSLNVSWQAVTGRPAHEVDVVAFVLDGSEKVTTDADFVFCNQPISEDAAVQLMENGSSEQGVRIDLAALPTWCRRVEVAAAIAGAGAFGEVGAVVVDADAGDDVSGTARPVATANLDAATTERTMLLASVYRRGDTWRLRAVGQGYDTGLMELATSFGVETDES